MSASQGWRPCKTRRTLPAAHGPGATGPPDKARNAHGKDRVSDSPFALTLVGLLIIGNVIGTFVSPFSPALWLALGLAGGANMGRYIKLAFPIAWAFSAALVLVAFASGMLG